jgi:colanic acid biosynthesis glycosyl transferase WcaI
MRILIVSQYFWPENFRVNELAAELVSRGHTVTVLTGRPNYPEGVVFPEFAACSQNFAQYAGADVVRVPLHPRGKTKWTLIRNYISFVFWGSWLGPWKLREKKFDAVFVYEISPITVALPAIVIGKLKRAPLLLWVLDLWPETLSAVGVVKSTRILNTVGLLVGFIYRRCNIILAQSKAFGKNIRKWAKADVRIEYFPAWGDKIFELPEAVPHHAALSAHAGKFCIVFAGNIGEAQDFPAVVEAARLLRNDKRIHWIIVGDGRAAPTLRAKIDEFGLQDVMFMLGRFPLSEMPAFFQAADALLVCLQSNPVFGMTIPGKVQSYMAAGVPLLGMLDGEGARVIEESGGGLVANAGDSEKLAANIMQMMNMPIEDRAKMGQNAAVYCQHEFARDRIIDRLESLIAEAGGSRSG